MLSPQRVQPSVRKIHFRSLHSSTVSANVSLNPRWCELAAKEINGDPNSLVRTVDSLTIKPLYTQEDLPKYENEN